MGDEHKRLCTVQLKASTWTGPGLSVRVEHDSESIPLVSEVTWIDKQPSLKKFFTSALTNPR